MIRIQKKKANNKQKVAQKECTQEKMQFPLGNWVGGISLPCEIKVKLTSTCRRHDTTGLTFLSNLRDNTLVWIYVPSEIYWCNIESKSLMLKFWFISFGLSIILVSVRETNLKRLGMHTYLSISFHSWLLYYQSQKYKTFQDSRKNSA